MSKGKRVKISKEILTYLLLSGMIFIASSSPYFVLSLLKNIRKIRTRDKQRDKQKVGNAFQYLRKAGLINIEKDGYDIRISLTEKGKKRAGKYQIDDLKITKPKKWDGKWRVVIFDIPDISKTVRNIFRGKLKELNFYALQKSVWAHPFDCQKEVKLLREFLGADNSQIQYILAEKIENEKKLKKAFGLTTSFN